MYCVAFNLRGEFAHYRYAFSNTNALTHKLPPKTAIIGMMGAVLGIPRAEFNQQVASWCHLLEYSVAPRHIHHSRSIVFTHQNRHITAIDSAKSGAQVGFYQRNLRGEFTLVAGRSPQALEYVINPDYDVLLASDDAACIDLLERFAQALQKYEAIFPPFLGNANCPASLTWLYDGPAQLGDGEFTTHGVVRVLPAASQAADYISETIPVRCVRDRVVLPEHYVQLFYARKIGAPTASKGRYLRVQQQHWASL